MSPLKLLLYLTAKKLLRGVSFQKSSRYSISAFCRLYARLDGVAQLEFQQFSKKQSLYDMIYNARLYSCIIM